MFIVWLLKWRQIKQSVAEICHQSFGDEEMWTIWNWQRNVWYVQRSRFDPFKEFMCGTVFKGWPSEERCDQMGKIAQSAGAAEYTDCFSA